jgi:DNA invertase Pin-like site-specific DNA recombinase
MKHTNKAVRDTIAKHLLDNPNETYKAVARRIGCSMSTVYNIAREYGVKRMPRLGIERIVRLKGSISHGCD